MKQILTILIMSLLVCFNLQAETYVVVAGVAKYKNLSSLTLCEKDAKAVAELYKKKTNYVVLLTGKYADKSTIIKYLKSQFAAAKPDDMVVFFFSGHGYQGGICPYDMDNSDASTGLSYKEIQAIMRSCKAKRKIIIADACFSGGLRQSPSSGSSDSYPSADVLLFLSSRTGETSIESRNMANGMFTTYLLRGLRGGADANRDRRITAKELFKFVNSGVKERTEQRQHPVMWGNFDDNFTVMDWRK